MGLPPLWDCPGGRIAGAADEESLLGPALTSRRHAQQSDDDEKSALDPDDRQDFEHASVEVEASKHASIEVAAIVESNQPGCGGHQSSQPRN